MHDGTFVQITPSAIRHVQDKGRVSEWDAGKTEPSRGRPSTSARRPSRSRAARSSTFEMTPQGNLVETERKELGRGRLGAVHRRDPGRLAAQQVSGGRLVRQDGALAQSGSRRTA